MTAYTRSLALWLLLPSAAFGATFTVGPGGSHAAVQDAVHAALQAGGSNEVRIAAGTFNGPFTVPSTMTGGTLLISGGWNTGFNLQVREPGRTILNAGGGGSTATIVANGGSVLLHNLTLTGGASSQGGGVMIATDGADIEIRDCRIVGNTVRLETEGSAAGGGLFAYLAGSSALRVLRSTLSSNAVTGPNASSGGAQIYMYGGATALVEGCTITGNTVVSRGQATGGGMLVSVGEGARATIRGNLVARNSTTPGQGYGSVGTGAALWAGDSGRVLASANAFLDNNGVTAVSHVGISANGTSSVRVTDSVIAGSSPKGVYIRGSASAEATLLNCTVTDHPSLGIEADRYSNIYNTIVYGNGQDIEYVWGTDIRTGGNLIGVDPRFVNAGRRDVRLAAGSPAIDAGVASAPGGLSATDFAALPRIAGARVDVGAHEDAGATASSAAALAHTTGFGGTPWRSDLDLVNSGARPAEVDLRFRTAADEHARTVMLAPGEARTWKDVLVSQFGVGASARTSGSLGLSDPSGAVVAAVRTYADLGANGTYGQGYPTLRSGGGIPSGSVAILPMVKSNASYYTTVGILNLGEATANARVTLYNAAGATVGNPLTVGAAPGRYAQLDDVVARAAADDTVAYATVEPLGSGTRVWGYGSVIDRVTRDPTTIEARLPALAGSVLRIASLAHTSGYGGTAWRSGVSIVNAAAAPANLTLTFRGASTVVRTATIPARGALEWSDVLVELFGYAASASASGALEIVADRRVVAACRTYADKGTAGTYGQSYPALVADDGIAAGDTGVLAQLRKNSLAYTNIGVLNLSTVACSARLRLRDASGAAIGTPLDVTPGPGAWLQLSEVFGAANAGGADAASAQIEVTSEGCRLWFYAAVIDALTRDPTTVELSRPLVPTPRL